MCFKPPKPPKVKPDKALQRQIEAGNLQERTLRSQNKLNRFEDQLGFLSGGFGRRSLLTGGRGGMGFGPVTGRSMFSALR